MTMETLVLLAAIGAAVAAVGAWIAVLMVLRLRASAADTREERALLERALRDESALSRREAADESAQFRREAAEEQAQSRRQAAEDSAQLRRESAEQSARSRQELAAALAQFSQTLTANHRALAEPLIQQLNQLADTNSLRLRELRDAVEQRLRELQTDNTAKLEEMRRTVDEKLDQTLEQRLGQSFKQVAERLEQVHRGLGEMQTLAAGVGDLKRVLTNVKTRGIWGEIQLGTLLEQVLTPEQFARNVATRRGSNDRVEFAIKLPGRDTDGSVVWLPIDAKFPREDYERLTDAQERGDLAGVEEAGRQLENRIKTEARNIRDKYIDPPNTTDFGLMFLPTEGLYADVLRRPGLAETLQREFRVSIAGPTTLNALLNSLQMGFRTLAIEKRSSEVWVVLGAVKAEFGKFGEVLAKTRKKLEEATNTIGNAETRTRQIERKLKTVEALPIEQAQPLLGEWLDSGSGEGDGGEGDATS